ncbi:MAG: iron donor protein CyaY [Rhodocyclaceae bacterium]|nr:iron donor protein CyaY [Rhodocyclaceae bacterium]
MDEAEFARLADRELAHLEAALDECSDQFELDPQPGGVLELEFDDGSKVVINRHLAAREIWVAARSGGFHFAPREGRWVSGRDGSELYEVLDRVLSAQSGGPVRVARRAD